MKYLIIILILFMGCKKEPPPIIKKVVSIEAKGVMSIDGNYAARPYAALLQVGKTYNIEVINSVNMDVYLRIIVEGKEVWYEKNENRDYRFLNIKYNFKLE